MSRYLAHGSMFVAVLFLLGAATSSALAQGQAKKYIIRFNDQADSDRAANRLKTLHGCAVGHVYRHALRGCAAVIPKARLAAVAADPEVLKVVEDLPVFGAGQVVPVGINRVEADVNPHANLDGVEDSMDIDIAILDTGIDVDHPDLTVVGGVRYTMGGPRTNYDDDNGHGSAVAGVIAAKDNGLGVVGVAPGARLWSVKVLNKFSNGSRSDIIKGIDWVTERAETIEVVNMSIQGRGDDSDPEDPYHVAIQNSIARGIVYVVAAGNWSEDAANTVPAAYDEVITVSAMVDTDGIPGGAGPSTDKGDDDTFASFSNFGPDVDIAAPGAYVHTTWLDGAYVTNLSGTSLATPHVTGAVALYIVANGRVSNAAGVDAIRQAILAAGTPQSDPAGFEGYPDDFPEPLLSVNFSGEPYHDVAVTRVEAPEAIPVGTTAVVTITVRNEGNFAENVWVSLKEMPAGMPIGDPELVALGGGQSAYIQFDWNTAGAMPGVHTLRGEVDPVSEEIDIFDNSSSTATTITAPHTFDTVTITKAEYKANPKRLTIEASCTEPAAVLTAYDDDTNAFLGVLENGSLVVKISPAPIIVRVDSDYGGTATRVVE